MRKAVSMLKFIPLFILLAGLNACALTPDTATQQAIDAALSPQPAKASAVVPSPPVPPAAVNAALLPPINIQVPGSSQAGIEPHFDIKVNRAVAREFFMGLVAGTPYNMVVHAGVRGHITLDLKNVTIPQVLRVVRNVYGYAIERTGNVYEVFPNALRTRIYKINYLDITRKGESQVRVSSGQVTQSPAAYRGRNGATMTGSASGEAMAGSKIVTHSDSDFWKGLRQSLSSIVGTKDGRKVVVSPQSGVVVVRAMPDELRLVTRYLRSTQAIADREVILEAKIIEVELSKGFQTGINWAALGQPGANKTVTLSQIGGGSIFSNGVNNSGGNPTGIKGNSGNLNPASYSPINNTAVQAFGGMFSMALNLHDFTAFLELLQTQGKVHVLSSPRIATINNQKAVIKVGTDEFFVTGVNSNTSATSGALATQSNVTLTPFFSGVALDVTPQIDAHGDVILHIHPTVSNVTQQIKNISTSTSNQITVPLANSTIRESDTIIRAKSGQVVVIGGLMQNVTHDEVASVPVLGDLPLIGGLFRHTKQVTSKSELVILLRPVVVEGSNTWSDALGQARDRIHTLMPTQWKTPVGQGAGGSP